MGWVNFALLGRGFRFRHADEVLRTLTAELRRRRPDRVLFSGDATALGFEPELRKAAELLGVGDPDLPGLAVPGNHDYYTRPCENSGRFEKHFAPWQTGVHVDGAVYPFAQQVGHVWVIGLNTATGNRWPWDAGGGVRADQLDRFARLLGQLPPGPRVVVTHFPVCLADGKSERKSHGLRGLQDVVKVAAEGGVSLWVHGHRHHPYFLPAPPQAPFPVVCAGSATQAGLWSYTEYRIEGDRCEVLRRCYDPRARRFEDAEAFEVTLQSREWELVGAPSTQARRASEGV
jgi:3',5'-cyclic AMP phosphodiesterase CpdA